MTKTRIHFSCLFVNHNSLNIFITLRNFLHLIVCSDPENDFKAQTVIHVLSLTHKGTSIENMEYRTRKRDSNNSSP